MAIRNSLKVLFFLLVLSLFANAQMVQTGTLSGLALEKGGEALPGITVTIKSPALILPQQTTVTNGQGYYRFPVLPPGVSGSRISPSSISGSTSPSTFRASSARLSSSWTS